jgi:hypothetical protein
MSYDLGPCGDLAPYVVTAEPELSAATPFKRQRQATRRLGSNPDYDGLDVVAFLRALGLRSVHKRGSEVFYSCPGPSHKRGDVRPSASMRCEPLPDGTGFSVFKCFHCSDEFAQGNAATFLAAFLKVTLGEVITAREATKRLVYRDYFGEGIRKPRERKTKRASGSMSDLHERAAFALDLVSKEVRSTKVVLALMEYFGVSKRTAERDVASVKGYMLSGIREVDGKRKIVNRRRLNAARLALRPKHKDIEQNMSNDLTTTLLGIREVDGKQKRTKADELEDWVSGFKERWRTELEAEERSGNERRRTRQVRWEAEKKERLRTRSDAFHAFRLGAIDAAEYCRRVPQRRADPKQAEPLQAKVKRAKRQYAKENELDGKLSLWDREKALARL